MNALPVWDEDGFKMCQSSAILRMLGIRLGYYSEAPMTIYAIDSMIDFVEDHQVKFTKYIIPVTQGQKITEEGSQEWFEGYWDKVIPIIDARLADHGEKFIAGTKRPTIADFKAF